MYSEISSLEHLLKKIREKNLTVREAADLINGPRVSKEVYSSISGHYSYDKAKTLFSIYFANLDYVLF